MTGIYYNHEPQPVYEPSTEQQDAVRLPQNTD